MRTYVFIVGDNAAKQEFKEARDLAYDYAKTLCDVIKQPVGFYPLDNPSMNTVITPPTDITINQPPNGNN